MKEHGILFSAPMVQAIRDRRKTQTRRLQTSPLGRAQVGDHLWVRETWSLWSKGHDAEISYPADGNRNAWQTGPNTGKIPDRSLESYFRFVDRSVAAGKRINIPGIHMPRWASRFTLEVTGTRVEWLDEISDADAEAEGVELESADPPFWYVPGLPTEKVHALPEKGEGPHDCYLRLWAHLHGEVFRQKVLVVEFRRIDG